MNITNNNLNLSTIQIKPRRVYKCPKCGYILPRKNVYKKEGIYYCSTDHTVVEDITDRETGQDFMQIVGI